MADGDDTRSGAFDGEADEPTTNDGSAATTTAGPGAPPTLASIARNATRRQEQAAAQPPGSPPAPAREAPSPPPPPPAPTRRGPIAQPASRTSRSETSTPPPGATAPTNRSTSPSTQQPPGSPVEASPSAPPTAPTAPSSGSTLPGPAGAPTDGLVRPAPSANPPAAPPPPYERPDLSDILDQLHDELDIEETPAPKDTGAALTDPRDLERPTDRNEIVVESEGGIEFQPTLASFATRLGGLIVDLVVVGLAIAPGILLAVLGGGAASIALGVAVSIVGFVLVTAWYARSVSRSGQWIGNRITGTRVVDARTGRNVDAGRAGTRFVVRHTASSFFLMGFIYALFDGQRQALHDRWADCVVITRTRETWSVDDEPPSAAT